MCRKHTTGLFDRRFLTDEFFDEDLLEEPLPEPRWRKPVIIALGIFLVILVSLWSFSDVLYGFVASSKVENSRVEFANLTVVFENKTFERLQQEFQINEHREIKACLFGETDGSLYYIREVAFPEVVRANALHVVAVSCPSEVLIDLHSHPINSCRASEQDLRVYAGLRARNPGARMMIMCARDRFVLA